MIGSAESWFHLPVRLVQPEEELTEPYRQSGWVHACIGAIIRNISSVPLVLYQGERRARVLVEDHPYVQLFRDPNPLQSGEEFIQLLFAYAECYGGMHILKTRMGRPAGSADGDPDAMWVLHTPAMELKLNDLRLPSHWEYGNQRVRFELDQVIYVKYPNPYKPQEGLAPLEPAAMAARQDYKAGQWNESFLDNGADPGGWLTSETPIRDEALRNRLEERVRRRYGGRHNAGRIPLFEAVKYTPNPRSQKDMEFATLKDKNRDEICTTFGVPLSVLGFNENINFATMGAQLKRFWKETLLPKMRLFTGMLDKHLKVDGHSWGWDLTTVAILQEDLQEKLETARMYRDLGYPVNEVNERLDLNMAEQEYGDVGLIQNQYVRLQDVVEGNLASQGGAAQGAAESSALKTALSRWVYDLRKEYRGGLLDRQVARDVLASRLRNANVSDPDVKATIVSNLVFDQLGKLEPGTENRFFNTLKSRMRGVAEHLHGRTERSLAAGQ